MASDSVASRDVHGLESLTAGRNGGAGPGEQVSAPDSAGSAKKKAKKRGKKKKSGKAHSGALAEPGADPHAGIGGAHGAERSEHDPEHGADASGDHGGDRGYDEDNGDAHGDSRAELAEFVLAQHEQGRLPLGARAKRRPVKRGPSSGPGGTSADPAGMLGSRLNKQTLASSSKRSRPLPSTDVPNILADAGKHPQQLSGPDPLLNGEPGARQAVSGKPGQRKPAVAGKFNVSGFKKAENPVAGLFGDLIPIPGAEGKLNTELSEYWSGLSSEERKKIASFEKNAVFSLINQERRSCACKTCATKQAALDDELKELYKTNEPRLKELAEIFQLGDSTRIADRAVNYVAELMGDDDPDYIFSDRPQFHALLEGHSTEKSSSPDPSPAAEPSLPPMFRGGANPPSLGTPLHSREGGSTAEPDYEAAPVTPMSSSDSHSTAPAEVDRAIPPPPGGVFTMEYVREVMRSKITQSIANGSFLKSTKFIEGFDEDASNLAAAAHLQDASSVMPSSLSGLPEDAEDPDKVDSMLSWINAFCENDGAKSPEQLNLFAKVFSSKLIESAPEKVKEIFGHFAQDIKDNNGQGLLSILEGAPNAGQSAAEKAASNEAVAKMAEYYKQVQGTSGLVDFDLDVRVDSPRPYVTNANVTKDASGQELLVDEVYSEHEYEDSELEEFSEEGFLEEDLAEEEAEDEEEYSEFEADQDERDKYFEYGDHDSRAASEVRSSSSGSHARGAKDQLDYLDDASMKVDAYYQKEQARKREVQVACFLTDIVGSIISQQVLKGYREHLARKRQQSLLDELAEEEAKAQADAARKQRDKDKKKTKKLAAKLQREEEAQRKAAEAKMKADAAREKENAMRQKQLALDRAKQEAHCRKIEERMAQLALEGNKNKDSSSEAPGTNAAKPDSRPDSKPDSSKPAGNKAPAETHASSHASPAVKEQELNATAPKQASPIGSSTGVPASKKDAKAKAPASQEKTKSDEAKPAKLREPEAKTSEKLVEKRQKAKEAEPLKPAHEKARQIPQKPTDTQYAARLQNEFNQAPVFNPAAPHYQPMAAHEAPGVPFTQYPGPPSVPMSARMPQQVAQSRNPVPRGMPPAVSPVLEDLSGLPSNLGAISSKLGPNAGSNISPTMGSGLGPNAGPNMSPSLRSSILPSMGPNMNTALGSNLGAGRSYSAAHTGSLGAIGNSGSHPLTPNAQFDAHASPGVNSARLSQAMHPAQDLGISYGGSRSSMFTGSPTSSGTNYGANFGTNSPPSLFSNALGAGMNKPGQQPQPAPSSQLPQYSSVSSLWATGGGGTPMSTSTAAGSAWPRSPWNDDRSGESNIASQRKASSPWINAQPGKPAASSQDISSAAKICYEEMQHQLGVDGFIPSQVLYHATQSKSGLRFNQNELYKACSQLPTFECMRDNVGLITHIKI